MGFVWLSRCGRSTLLSPPGSSNRKSIYNRGPCDPLTPTYNSGIISLNTLPSDWFTPTFREIKWTAIMDFPLPILQNKETWHFEEETWRPSIISCSPNMTTVTLYMRIILLFSKIFKCNSHKECCELQKNWTFWFLDQSLYFF